MTLFPSGIYAECETVAGDIPLFTLEELGVATSSLNLKNPVPDMVPAAVVREVTSKRPQKVLGCMSMVLTAEWISESWKEATMVLLKKTARLEEGSVMYRPLCLLNCFTKVLKKFLLGRIYQHLHENLHSHPNLRLNVAQYGFRKGTHSKQHRKNNMMNNNMMMILL